MNPWTALMQPIRSRPGDPPPKAPKAQAPTRTADSYTVRPAAALVVTETRIHDRPEVRLLPIIALEFAA